MEIHQKFGYEDLFVPSLAFPSKVPNYQVHQVPSSAFVGQVRLLVTDQIFRNNFLRRSAYVTILQYFTQTSILRFTACLLV